MISFWKGGEIMKTYFNLSYVLAVILGAGCSNEKTTKSR